MNRGKHKAYAPNDFLIEWDRPGAKTPDEMRAMMISLTLQLGGKVE